VLSEGAGGGRQKSRPGLGGRAGFRSKGNWLPRGGLMSEGSRRRSSLRFTDSRRPSRGTVGLLAGEYGELPHVGANACDRKPALWQPLFFFAVGFASQ
jgi:hypothetical protein